MAGEESGGVLRVEERIAGLKISVLLWRIERDDTQQQRQYPAFTCEVGLWLVGVLSWHCKRVFPVAAATALEHRLDRGNPQHTGL